MSSSNPTWSYLEWHLCGNFFSRFAILQHKHFCSCQDSFFSVFRALVYLEYHLSKAWLACLYFLHTICMKTDVRKFGVTIEYQSGRDTTSSSCFLHENFPFRSSVSLPSRSIVPPYQQLQYQPFAFRHLHQP